MWSTSEKWKSMPFRYSERGAEYADWWWSGRADRLAERNTAPFSGEVVLERSNSSLNLEAAVEVLGVAQTTEEVSE